MAYADDDKCLERPCVVIGPAGPQGPAGPAGSGAAAFTASFLPQQLPQFITPKTLAVPVPVGYFVLQAGNYFIYGTVDVIQPSVQTAEYVKCQLSLEGAAEPFDITSSVWGTNLRFPLGGILHLDEQARVLLSCGSDWGAFVTRGNFSVVELARVDFAQNMVLGQ